MKSKILLVLLFITTHSTIYSQKEANIWYFGYRAGIDFNSGVPVATNGGNMYSFEGSANICDPNTGEMLFYTNGVIVWNKLDVPMPNGLGLLSDDVLYSAGQQAIIVPQPGNDSIYYIFTTDAKYTNVTATHNGINYSTVNINLNNGLGDVTTKNVNLLPIADEKITAVKHCNGKDFWIIAHAWGNNSYFVWLLSSSGISAPVISPVGSIISGNSNYPGVIKFTPDGRRMAVTNASLNIEIFDFNSSDGTLSNPVTLTNQGNAYGLEFSQNSRLMYITSDDNLNNRLYQYNLDSIYSVTALLNSRITLATASGSNPMRQIQIGPDSSIYINHFRQPPTLQQIDRIKFPNIIGTGCSYQNSVLTLLSDSSNLGFPNFPSSYFNPNIILDADFNYLSACKGDTFKFSDASSTGVTKWDWAFGDPSSGLNNTDTIFNPTHIYHSSGPYNVTLTVKKPDSYGCIYQSSVSKKIYVLGDTSYTLPSDTVCKNDSINIGISNSSNMTYQWTPITGLNDPTISDPKTSVSNSEDYTLFLSNGTCTDTIYKSIIIDTIGAFTLNDTSICRGDTIEIGIAQKSGYNYFWTTASGHPEPFGLEKDNNKTTIKAFPIVSQSYVLNEYNNFCKSSDMLNITVIDLKANAGNDVEMCLGNSIQIGSTFGTTLTGVRYSWIPPDGLNNPNARRPIATPQQTIEYIFSVTDPKGYCTAFDSMTVTILTPEFTLGNDTTICYGDSIQIGVPANPDHAYLWSPNYHISNKSIAQPWVSPDTSTSYILSVSNGTTCVGKDTITVNVHILPFVYAGNDTIICPDSQITIGSPDSVSGITYSWSPIENLTKTSTSITLASPKQSTIYVLTSSDTICSYNDSISIFIKDITSSLPADTTICMGDEITLSINPDGIKNVLWLFSDVTNNEIYINSAGLYIVEIEDTLSCLFSDTIVVKEDTCMLFIPNSFSPNKDGINDYFYVSGGGVKRYHVAIYDRMGKIVFESYDSESKWDGNNNQITEIYAYTIDVQFNNGIHKKYLGNISTLQ